MILHTSIQGNGEPLLFLHTGLQTGNTDFQYQQDFFKDSYRVFAPDLRAHGHSASNDIENFFLDSAQDLLETINHYELEKVHLVGCSLGAIVAVHFARLFPERIQTITVSGIMPVKPVNWLELHVHDVKVQEQLLANEEFTNYFNTLHSSDWKKFIYIGEKEDWYPFEGMLAMYRFQFPVLYIVGEANAHETVGATIYPKENKHIHVAVVPFAGHLVHEDQPAIYTNIVKTFLDSSHT
ncbi:MAG: alpha/beta hydrolase [Psychrobacillus sp.]